MTKYPHHLKHISMKNVFLILLKLYEYPIKWNLNWPIYPSKIFNLPIHPPIVIIIIIIFFFIIFFFIFSFLLLIVSHPLSSFYFDQQYCHRSSSPLPKFHHLHHQPTTFLFLFSSSSPPIANQYSHPIIFINKHPFNGGPRPSMRWRKTSLRY